ncbi:MAG: 4-(cytidine 5'-diphospho)-2-C-methyl-D-erythritol kinase, partial [Desulfobulbus sp.]|nr:4-(cytidine 5'-diphospho)-2-C-methyl-D-erythritol kinase [Desulfobulbus sp.]
MRLKLRAPAKINLNLHITGRRADGYHLLDSLMQKVSLYDDLDLELCPDGISLQCSGEPVPAGGENIAVRAAELFFAATAGRKGKYGNGVHISLVKRIPVAAGLGGGSSNAAAILKGLNVLCGHPCSEDELMALGLQLGADVPFFLADTGTARATGIGEILHPAVSLGNFSVLLVNPGVPVSTRWVYETFALTARRKNDSITDSQKDVSDVTGGCDAEGEFALPAVLENDLEAITIARVPEVGLIKDGLLKGGAFKAMMTGSGPTVFGLFADMDRLDDCYALFRSQFVHTFIVAPVQ